MHTSVNIDLFRLELLDINDNNPVFPHDNISLDISENAIIGQPIRLESATDRDPDFGIVSYQLTGNKKVFELKEEYNQDGTIIPSLILQSNLDREKTAQYQVILCLLRPECMVRAAAVASRRCFYLQRKYLLS